jgi:hypothetical protein
MTQKKARLASGLDELSFVDAIRNEKGEYATALTTSSGKGRLIRMVDSGNENNNAIQLQHESYRDGIKSIDQVGETVQVVIAHTAMADRMRRAGAGYENPENLAWDLAAWDKAVASGDMSGFALCAMSNYDSSRDFWTLTADGGLKYDGEGWLKDENGMYISKDDRKTAELRNDTVGAAGIETGLINILALNPAKAEDVKKVQDMMMAAGLQYRIKEGGDSEDRMAWYWDGSVTEANSEITIGQDLLAPMGMVHLPEEMYTAVEKALSSYVKAAAVSQTTPADVQPGYPNQPQFESGKYKAEPGVTKNTWCNRASYRTNAALLGVEMANMLVTEEGIGYTNANAMGKLLAEKYSSVEGWEVQDAANKGAVGKVLFINPTGESGHIATVITSYGTYIPALGPMIAQAGLTNGEMWAVKGFWRDFSSSNYYIFSQDILQKANITRYMTYPSWGYAGTRK